MPTRRERRLLTELKCQSCGHEFEDWVLHVSQGVEESSEWTPWKVLRIDVNCPECGSGFVGERNA
jgi:rubredoxin